MKDYKFNEAAKVDPAYKKFSRTLKNAALTDVVHAFGSNIDRMICLADFATDVVDLSATYTRIATQVCLHVTGKPMVSPDDIQADPSLMDRITEGMTPLIAEHAAKELSDPSHIANSRAHAVRSMKQWFDLYPHVAIGVEGLFAAVLTSMWTAFETLASDLWITTLNAHPSGLADLTGRPNRIGKIGGEKRWDDERTISDDPLLDMKNTGKIVRLQDIQKLTHGDYDIRRRMGDLLKDRFKFTTLRGIREAYSTAFSEHEKAARAENIDKALANNGIDALSIVRNLIVHKAGIADLEYEARSKRYPLAPQLIAGQPMRLDGKICCDLVASVLSSSLALVKAVDVWLTLTQQESTPEYVI